MRGREKERERRERDLEKKAREQADQCGYLNIECDKWYISHVFSNHLFSSIIPVSFIFLSVMTRYILNLC